MAVSSHPHGEKVLVGAICEDDLNPVAIQRIGLRKAPFDMTVAVKAIR